MMCPSLSLANQAMVSIKLNRHLLNSSWTSVQAEIVGLLPDI